MTIINALVCYEEDTNDVKFLLRSRYLRGVLLEVETVENELN